MLSTHHQHIQQISIFSFLLMHKMNYYCNHFYEFFWTLGVNQKICTTHEVINTNYTTWLLLHTNLIFMSCQNEALWLGHKTSSHKSPLKKVVFTLKGGTLANYASLLEPQLSKACPTWLLVENSLCNQVLLFVWTFLQEGKPCEFSIGYQKIPLICKPTLML
jgi:hypothetical protein